ncbi:hypothetical protein RvY_13690 [Ramazzottius varieornatus]|uniref:Uncharacterized protein n=1 Tax=Ramazzottius varieornatus TaxID=947166 RepID=A0A1D1VTZ6_RAMVA|nr:hypothetical protein RvY_13690 [Ramazzottius varieornatus]
MGCLDALEGFVKPELEYSEYLCALDFEGLDIMMNVESERCARTDMILATALKAAIFNSG